MKIMIEVDPATVTAVGQAGDAAQQPASAAPPLGANAGFDIVDGGAGPGAGEAGSGSNLSAASSTELDAAGPPQALLDSIAAAERADGDNPAFPLAGGLGSEPLVDGGVGPAKL